MSDLNERRLIIRRDKFELFLDRLPAASFRREERGVWANLNVDANLKRIHWEYDSIDHEKWIALIVYARESEKVPAELQSLGLCQIDEIVSDEETRAELERELSKAKDYWQQTIYPYIEDPMEDLAQWFVVHEAHGRLYDATRNAGLWNRTLQGRQLPVSALPDLGAPEFREPRPLCRSECVRQQLETVPLRAGLSPDEAVRQRHLDLLAAQRYFESLPDNPERPGTIFALYFTSIAFDKILRSNSTARQLPLLPPASQDGVGPLSKEALKQIVLNFVQKHTSQSLTKEEFEREQEQTQALAKEGKLIVLGTGKLTTFDDYQVEGQNELKECLNHERVSLGNLCKLRRERFDQHGHAPQLIAKIRELPEPAREEESVHATPGQAASVRQTMPRSPEINEAILWNVQQKIQDELDIELKSAPSASQVFTLYCRDRMKLVDMQKSHGWKIRTLKSRKAALKRFLHENFSGLTLEAFFVDRSVFKAAERQLEDQRARRISRRALGECETDGRDD